jgi:predicted Zn-dependent peptidase
VSSLDNGMSVWAYDLPGQYILSCYLVLDLPLNAEAIDGVGTVAIRCLDEGTHSHPGESFAETLGAVGGQFHGLVGNSTTQILLDVPQSRLAQALPLYAEAVREPLFEADAIERVIGNRLAEIEQQEAHGSAVASRALRQTLLAPGLRMGRPSGGTIATVERLTRDNVAEHHLLYSPRGAVLIVAGDLSGSADVHSLVEEAFGTWNPDVTPTVPEVPAPGTPRRATIRRPGAVQVDVRMGWYGVGHLDERWAPLQVALAIMGGSFMSRLNSVLREERGYTYGISMYPRPFRTGGTIEVSTSTRTDAAAALVDEGLEILAARKPFTEEETAAAIGYLVGSTPLSLDTAEAVASQGATIAAARLPLNYVDTILADLAAVTPEAATAAYRSLVIPEKATVITVGDL